MQGTWSSAPHRCVGSLVEGSFVSGHPVLDALRQGNTRFMAGDVLSMGPATGTAGAEIPVHAPRAVIVACSDARVPVEHVFHQVPGVLFVVRVAGQVLEPAGLASIRFAVAQLGTRVVVVLGHEACAAVQAALAPCRDEAFAPLVEPIRRRIASLENCETLTEEEATRRNVVATVKELGAFLERDSGIDPDEVVVAGAVCSLRTREVDWLD